MSTDIRPLSLSVVLVESVTVTMARYMDTKDKRQEKMKCFVNDAGIDGCRTFW